MHGQHAAAEDHFRELSQSRMATEPTSGWLTCLWKNSEQRDSPDRARMESASRDDDPRDSRPALARCRGAQDSRRAPRDKRSPACRRTCADTLRFNPRSEPTGPDLTTPCTKPRAIHPGDVTNGRASDSAEPRRVAGPPGSTSCEQRFDEATLVGCDE